MYLRFFGREAGFGYEHTSAYFTTKYKDLVIIDLPVSTFQKLKNSQNPKLKDHFIYVLITHTHPDNVNGLGLFIHYAYNVLDKKITIIAPSSKVGFDLRELLKIHGVADRWYNLQLAPDFLDKKWFIQAIPTPHCPELEGKCFGYKLSIDDTTIIYTGDTCNLNPFLPHIKANSILYVDVSVKPSLKHLMLGNIFNELISLSKKAKCIYLMHLDDAQSAYNMVQNCPKIKIVDIWPC